MTAAEPQPDADRDRQRQGRGRQIDRRRQPRDRAGPRRQEGRAGRCRRLRPVAADACSAADAKPTAEDDRLIPVEAHGLKFLSLGHLVSPGHALAWRGPMATGALAKLIEADWGDAEMLIVDLPPGTGDVQLSLIQQSRPAGAVIVSTPQDLSLIDARRAIDLFNKMSVPVLGIIENMAGYVCPHCGEASASVRQRRRGSGGRGDGRAVPRPPAAVAGDPRGVRRRARRRRPRTARKPRRSPRSPRNCWRPWRIEAVKGEPPCRSPATRTSPNF